MEAFRWCTRGLNRLVMLPWFRFGRGPRPTRAGGWLCVLRTRGRRSGKAREIPLDYAPAGSDAIWIGAGFGERTQWLHNVRADPHVEVNLQGRWRRGLATEITDPGERVRGGRELMTHAGFMGYIYGFSPYRVSDRRLARALRDMVLLRVDLSPST
ncbi:MAG TPA: nitroreductase family deazaflavin-dependent oxidoreductase [Candidatus Limnocylindria bacterium]